MEKSLYETRQEESHNQMHIYLKINSGCVEKMIYDVDKMIRA